MSRQDYSDYSTVWTRPRKMLAKRLTKPMKVLIVQNGVTGELDGEAGHFHIVELTEGGNEPRERLYTQEQFEKKFREGGKQGELMIPAVELTPDED